MSASSSSSRFVVSWVGKFNEDSLVGSMSPVRIGIHQDCQVVLGVGIQVGVLSPSRSR
jgi:hypothetical protein